MGLTSNKFLALAVLAAVALFVVTIVLWPRLARRGWRPVLARTGLLLMTQVLIFAAVGLTANRSFLFYASWADLFGQEQAQGVVVDHSAGPAGTSRLTVVEKQTVPVPGSRQPSAGGQIQKIVVRGGTSGINSSAYVYLPPEYFRPGHAKKSFPASVVLTGYPGNAKSLIKVLKYPTTADRLTAEGKMRPMILVMLRPTVAPLATPSAWTYPEVRRPRRSSPKTCRRRSRALIGLVNTLATGA